jgi:hypothetical protein
MGLYKRDKKLGKAVRHDIRILEKKLRIQAKRIVENREVRFYQPAGPFGRMTPVPPEYSVRLLIPIFSL